MSQNENQIDSQQNPGELAKQALSLLDSAFRDDPGDSPDAEHSRLHPYLDDALLDVLRDFLGRPSKGVRASLVEASWRLAGRAAEEMPAELPILVELLHAGSLMVDDVQDDALTRRGRPSAHRLFGTAKTINAGGWLYFFPLVLTRRLPISEQVRLALLDRINLTVLRCHQGQALDLSTRISQVPAERIGEVVATITRMKTGALMGLSMAMGALAAGASTQQVEHLERFGEQVGTALQMYDDLSGLLCEERAHKAHEDLTGGRPIWPWAWLKEVAGSDVYETLSRADCPDASSRETLRITLAEHVGEHGRRVARTLIDEACRELREAMGPSDACQEIVDRIHELEAYYVV